MTDHELVETLRKLRMDLTGMQVKVSEALRMATAMQLEPAQLPRCDRCGPIKLPAGVTLADHRANVHGLPHIEAA